MKSKILELAHQVQLWLPKETSLYHATISLILSQRISFAASRKIRQNLYGLIGTNILTPEAMSKLSTDDLKSIGIRNPDLIQSITNLALQNKLDINTLRNLTGIEPWTLKGLLIMTYSDPDVFLAKDLYIRKRLQDIYGRPKVLTIKEAEQLAQSWKGHRSIVSRFLWRLKKDSSYKIREGIELTREDFL